MWLRRVTAAWQQARISNFDYLLYLNFAAGGWVGAQPCVLRGGEGVGGGGPVAWVGLRSGWCSAVLPAR